MPNVFWQGFPFRRKQLVGLRFPKHLLPSRLHHLAFSLSTLANFDPCQFEEAPLPTPPSGSNDPLGGLGPRWDRHARPCGVPTRPPLVSTTRAPDEKTFEARCPGFPSDCLRFAAAVARRH